MIMRRFIKADIIDAIANRISLSRQDTKRVIDQFIIEVRNCLTIGESLEIRGLGTFITKIRKARSNARNPRSGKTISIGARRVAAFRPSKLLKAAIQQHFLAQRYKTNDALSH